MDNKVNERKKQVKDSDLFSAILTVIAFMFLYFVLSGTLINFLIKYITAYELGVRKSTALFILFRMLIGQFNILSFD